MRNPSKNVLSLLVLALTFTFFSTSALAFPGAGGQPSAAPATGSSMTAAEGLVVQTMNSGGYTYLLIDSDGQRTWAAIPGTEIQVGQEVKLSPGMIMKGFTSQTLGRTFESILFSQGLVSVK